MEIAEIKSKLTLLQVLSSYNLTPDKNNRLCCLWHKDKTPSLQIYPKTNTWTCFSSNCNAGSGDQIDFIMKYERISKHEAIMKAKQILGYEQEVPLGKVAILTKYYQGSLHSMQRSKKGKEYAKSRNLDVDKLKIGFCGYEVGKTWSEKLQENAKKIGLFKIKNCIIFPTKNKQNQIVSIYGRSVSSNLPIKSGQAKVRHFYLSGGFKGLYPSYPKSETRRLVLTESIVDAATIIHYTDEAVLALYGTNGFTAEHERAIKNLEQLEEVVLFFDGDEAGKAAVEKYKIKLQELRKDIKISCVNTPQGEDINSLVVSHEPEILNHLIDNRSFLFSIENKKDRVREGKLHTENPDLLLYETEVLNITILGGVKIMGLDRMRVTLKVEKKEYSHHIPVRHSLDLYHSKQVESLVQKMSEGLELGMTESERTISQMTSALEVYRNEQLELLKPKKVKNDRMTQVEELEAMKYLQDKKLMRNTLTDIARTGLVGETNNALIAYLAYTSRKREKPLHIMCLGASGMGKTYLQEKISELVPEEEKIEITSLSDNALYYFGLNELKHKLLLIEDLDGAENALYPLRELQSKRRLGKTVTIKDSRGKSKTENLKVNGPVCVSSCTTRERIYEDNANRCILLYIDGSQAQDKRIMSYQQRSSAGNINKREEHEIKIRLKNVQRLLEPIKVVNPYAELIDLPQEVFKPRRTLLLLLSFIETVSYYHQYQREVKQNKETGERYIESTKEDIEASFSLLKEVLFSKSDELSKASRLFLERLKKEVNQGEVFYTSKIRKQLRISSTSLKRYLLELSRNGYIKVKGGSRHKGYEYEINDYEEYETLRSSIDEKLEEILSKMR